MTPPSSQSTSIIAILSLLVTILAVFVGPLMTWTIARRQIEVAAREAWMREFREKVAAFIYAYDNFLIHIRTHTTGDTEKEKQLADINNAQRLPYHTIRLLIAEKGTQYTAFGTSIDRLLSSTTNEIDARREVLFKAAESILQQERAAIAANPGIWNALLRASSLCSKARQGRLTP
jgi:hypothetical protein